MDYAYWKTLTLDRKSLFINLIERMDKILNGLISSASNSGSMRKPTEILSTNLDFKKKAFTCFGKFVVSAEKIGIAREFIQDAVDLSAFELNKIVEGQPRSHVRDSLNNARVSFIYSFQLNGAPLVSFTSTHPAVHGHRHREKPPG